MRSLTDQLMDGNYLYALTINGHCPFKEIGVILNSSFCDIYLKYKTNCS